MLAAKRELARRELRRRKLIEFAKHFANFDFEVDWYHEEICAALEDFVDAVANKESPRLIIEAPPRHGKSQLVVRSLVPWFLGHHPDWQSIVATYGIDLSQDHGRDIRDIMSNPDYARLFPDAVLDKRQKSTTSLGIDGTRGQAIFTGIRTATTGKGAEVLVVDDPVKDYNQLQEEGYPKTLWDFYNATAQTRLSPGGGIIVMATRWGELDLTGQILASPAAKRFRIITLKAIATEDEEHRKKGEGLSKRWTQEQYEQLRIELDAKTWSSLYQQSPYVDEGAVFKREWFKLIDKSRLPESLNYYITSDPAASMSSRADYSVICVWGVDTDGCVYLADSYRKRGLDVDDYISAFIRFARHYKPIKVYIERCHATNVMEPALKRAQREQGVYFAYETPTTGGKDKLARSTTIAGMAQAGQVYLVDNGFARDEALPELLHFPDGRNDDIVDCFSLIGMMADKLMRASKPSVDKPAPQEDVLDFLNRRRRAQKQKSGYKGLAKQPRKLF